MWHPTDLDETRVTLLSGGGGFAPALRAGLLVLAALFIAPEARAACACGFVDGQFSLYTETIDGTFSGSGSNWDEVHADLDNNVCDASDSTDLDDGDINSDARDIIWFAYTWDANYIYFFTERVSSSGTQRFIYYADEDSDGFMEDGESAIAITWQGSGVTVQRYTYDAVNNTTGDPTSTGGVADGHELAGSFLTGSAITLTYGSAGATGNQSSGGTQLEFRVSWDHLTGDSDGSLEASDGPKSVQFHVSSMNASFNPGSAPPSNLQDDLSGCGGGVGSTQFADLTFAPAAVTLTATHDTGQPSFPYTEQHCAAHAITNDGNDFDVFNITNSALPSYVTAFTLYSDNDASGTLTGGDTALADEPEPETPTSRPALDESNTTVDTDVLAAGATKNILACYTINFTASYTPAAGNSTVTLTASSAFEPLVTAAVVDTLTIVTVVDLSMMKLSTAFTDPVTGASNPKRIPGAFVNYALQLTNYGGRAIDANSIVLSDTIASNLDLFVNTLGGTPAGPVAQTNGATACGLVAASLTVLYSKTVGVLVTDPDTSYAATTTADGNGVDAAVTAIRLKPSGTFVGQSTATAPSCTWTYRVRVE